MLRIVSLVVFVLLFLTFTPVSVAIDFAVFGIVLTASRFHSITAVIPSFTTVSSPCIQNYFSAADVVFGKRFAWLAESRQDHTRVHSRRRA